MAETLPVPRAILVVSAHWLTHCPTVSAASTPATIHDFAGFPAELYALDYPAPGAAALAARIAELLAERFPERAIDPVRGLDHGAWVPLRVMYPQADIPVTQLSVMPDASPAEHRALGAALAPLTREGVLILGSGGLTHNLHEANFTAPEDEAPDYVNDFREQFIAALRAGDEARLDNYRAAIPHARRAHPTPEHLLPLFVALGAAGPGAMASVLHTGTLYGALAMDALSFSQA